MIFIGTYTVSYINAFRWASNETFQYFHGRRSLMLSHRNQCLVFHYWVNVIVTNQVLIVWLILPLQNIVLLMFYIYCACQCHGCNFIYNALFKPLGLGKFCSLMRMNLKCFKYKQTSSNSDSGLKSGNNNPNHPIINTDDGLNDCCKGQFPPHPPTHPPNDQEPLWSCGFRSGLDICLRNIIGLGA